MLVADTDIGVSNLKLFIDSSSDLNLVKKSCLKKDVIYSELKMNLLFIYKKIRLIDIL